MRHFYNHGNPRNFDPVKMDLVAGEIVAATRDIDIRCVAVVHFAYVPLDLLMGDEEGSQTRCKSLIFVPRLCPFPTPHPQPTPRG